MIFMGFKEKRKRFLIMMCVLSGPLYASEIIINEYPELGIFLNSPDFKTLLLDYTIEVEENGSADDPMAQVQFEFDGNLTKRMIFNPYYINRKLLTPQEYKYILCHELGHIQDNNLIKKIILPTVGLPLFGLGIIISACKSLVEKQYSSFLKKSSIGMILYFIGYLILMKWLRDGETYADTYAFHLTKNKRAAISALEKRKVMVTRSNYSNKFLKKLCELFDDHPSEDIRIRHIQGLESL